MLQTAKTLKNIIWADSKNKMSECKGTVYIVGGKRFCVGEKVISKKRGLIKSAKNRKGRKNSKRNKTRRK